jgi:hypothetical protein
MAIKMTIEDHEDAIVHALRHRKRLKSASVRLACQKLLNDLEPGSRAVMNFDFGEGFYNGRCAYFTGGCISVAIYTNANHGVEHVDAGFHVEGIDEEWSSGDNLRDAIHALSNRAKTIAASFNFITTRLENALCTSSKQ